MTSSGTGFTTVKPPRGVILYAHGNGTTLPPACRACAGWPLRSVWSGFAFEYPGYFPESRETADAATTTSSSMLSSWAASSGAARCGERARGRCRLVPACLDQLQWDQDQIFLWGRSIGAAVVADLAAALTERNLHVGGLVLITPFSSIKDMAVDIVGSTASCQRPPSAYNNCSAVKRRGRPDDRCRRARRRGLPAGSGPRRRGGREVRRSADALVEVPARTTTAWTRSPQPTHASASGCGITAWIRRYPVDQPAAPAACPGTDQLGDVGQIDLHCLVTRLSEREIRARRRRAGRGRVAPAICAPLHPDRDRDREIQTILIPAKKSVTSGKRK